MGTLSGAANDTRGNRGGAAGPGAGAATASSPMAGSTRWPWRCRVMPWSKLAGGGHPFRRRRLHQSQATDHLDYHGTMEAYFEAKVARSSRPDHALRGVVNAGRRVGPAPAPPGAVSRWWPCGAATPATSCSSPAASRSTWRGHHGRRTPWTGSINVDNALLAAEAAVALGLDPPRRGSGRTFRGVALVPWEGCKSSPWPATLPLAGRSSRRIHRLHRGHVVDYAHTPAGLEVVLREARGLTKDQGRVLVVFGCGGNRDRAKRPKMGRAASLMSDVAVLTSDNPRDEQPLAIIEEVRAGVPTRRKPSRTRRGLHCRTRPAARHPAGPWKKARGNDVVVIIAGKGHETYQEINGDLRLPFDDVVESAPGSFLNAFQRIRQRGLPGHPRQPDESR